jgi:hypothetical protein
MRVDWLQQQPLVQTAARVASTFGLNPLDVLRVPEVQQHILIAAMQVIGKDEERQAKQNKS